MPAPKTTTELPMDHPSNRSDQITSGPGRILDACLNRAREGLRVLEDYARFMMDSEFLVHTLKDLRHRLVASERLLSATATVDTDAFSVMSERDVAGDTGTCVTGSLEQQRSSVLDIVHANARRVQESLRSLEEFGKLLNPVFAAEMKQMRYDIYEVHQRLSAVADCHGPFAVRRERLRTARVCVLVSQDGCCHPWKQVVESCLAGGADIIQLREKQLTDRELLLRARWLCGACRAAGTLFIVNDRPDIACMSKADGVHLGQDDCAVTDARGLIGADRLIGLSTHSVADMDTAEAHSADYLGVGPVFPSVTKQFECFAGLKLVRDAVRSGKPWFAIGGIQQDNVELVTDSGASRIAVSSAVVSAENPELVVSMLREGLITV